MVDRYLAMKISLLFVQCQIYQFPCPWFLPLQLVVDKVDYASLSSSSVATDSAYLETITVMARETAPVVMMKYHAVSWIKDQRRVAILFAVAIKAIAMRCIVSHHKHSSKSMREGGHYHYSLLLFTLILATLILSHYSQIATNRL